MESILAEKQSKNINVNGFFLITINSLPGFFFSPVTAFLKESTYKYAVSLAKSKSNTTVGDVNILDNLIEQDKLHLIAADKEDIYWVDYAVAENALIVTHDKFRNEMKEYQDRDWKDINKRTLRDFKFVNNKFILPSLKKKEVTRKQEEKQITLDQIFSAIQQRFGQGDWIWTITADDCHPDIPIDEID